MVPLVFFRGAAPQRLLKRRLKTYRASKHLQTPQTRPNDFSKPVKKGLFPKKLHLLSRGGEPPKKKSLQKNLYMYSKATL